MIFAGSKRDLEQLDALCVEVWSAMVRDSVRLTSDGPAGGLTRVQAAGRVQVWPGDPDDVATMLMARGFGVSLIEKVGDRGITAIVVVTGRL